jgi:hypothetical protein
VGDPDGDGVVDEAPCGGDNSNPNRRPERIDAAFPGDDDGDTQVNEPLPPGSSNYDCDGDGFKGNQENLIYLNAPSTTRDQDPCGNNGWPLDLVSSNSVNIADINSFLNPLRTGDNVDAHGAYNMFGHALDDDGDTTIESNENPNSNGGPNDPPTFNVARWNLSLPPHLRTTLINIQDLNAILAGAFGSPARPPMFLGGYAFFTNSGQCPWPP